MPYLLSALGTVIVVGIRLALDPLLGEAYPFVFFLVPSLLVANRFGWKPGVFALLLGLAAGSYFFATPRFTFWVEAPASQVGVLIYLALGAGGIVLLEQGRAAGKTRDALRLRDRAIQAVSQGIVITDPARQDNPIIYASPGFERLTGYSASEVVGSNCRFLQGADTDPSAVATLREAITSGRECSVEILNYQKDGTPFWNALYVTPVREGPLLVNYVGVQVDVTERRALEEQLRQAQKMEAVGQLVGGVAHDFNNVLTVITGYSDLMLATLPEEDPNLEAVNAISLAGYQATLLARQLLAFSRQTVPEPQVLDLNEVVRENEFLLKRLIGEAIRVYVRPDPSVRRVKLDPGQLGQVIMNLAVNARDAMPGGGTLTIETGEADLDEGFTKDHPEVAPGRYVVLTVTDDGQGMSPEVRSRIFDPLFTTKRMGKGTGLGLAVVQSIVKRAGGAVEVSSEAGVGTSFKVYLPGTDESAKRRAAGSVRGGETVLVVEDESGVRALAETSLKMHGYKVLAAEDAEEALKVVDRHAGPIHLLATDVVIPGISGPDLAERLHERIPGLKVLFMSGYSDDVVTSQGRSRTGGAFLQKPYTPRALAQKVRAVLDRN